MARTKTWPDAQRCEVPAYFLFPAALEPLGWNQRWRFTRREARWKLEPKMAPARDNDQRLVPPRYSGTFSRSTRGVLKNISTPTTWAEGEVAAPSFCRRQGCWSSRWFLARRVPAHSAGSRTGQALKSGVPPCLGPAGSRDWCWISGCRVWGFELGDRRTTRAKARFKLNRDGK